jgi:DNA processing protein
MALNVNSFYRKIMKINEISPLNNNFTEVLGGIALMPKTLYYRGKLPEKRLLTVGIVGARKATKYGLETAYRLSYDLAKRGVVVVSGLAFGIDAMSHRGALDAGGITLAVLASGVDEITPHSNSQLGAQILAHDGAILSEYPANTPPLRPYFLARNRLISGLSDAVIVVEANTKSGSLSTAAHAKNQGRAVFAVPNGVNSPMSEGCNLLIKRGAHLLTEANDLLEVLAPEKIAKIQVASKATTTEQKILKLIKSGVNDTEKIAENLKIPPADLAQTLTMMEFDDLIQALGDIWVVKK